MFKNIVLLLGAGFLMLTSCRKTEVTEPDDSSTFQVNLHNTFNVLEAQYAAFLTDKNGAVHDFQWLQGDETTQLTVPGAGLTDRFDCTVLRMDILIAPGTGIHDTTVSLTTYTNLFSGANIHLRDPNFLQSTDLTINFTNVNSIDSIIVPQGLTFARPQAANNFIGQYRILHTGRLWCRLLINGESKWRYALFEDVQGDSHSATVDAATLPQITSFSASVDLPLLTNWSYELDRIMDLDQHDFLSLGANLPIPGGPVPIFDKLVVFEPPALPVKGYRLRLSGYNSDPNGTGYSCDRYYQTLPVELVAPNFNILSATTADDRWTSIQCNGLIDLLAITRSNSGSPHIRWEAFVAPSNFGGTTYRLPNVPAELSNAFPALGNYDFDGKVEIRAEGYDNLNAYPEVIARRMLQDEPLWQMKAGYTAIMRVFNE